MKFTLFHGGILALLVLGHATPSVAQQAGEWGTARPSAHVRPADEKFTFILFWKENNPSKQEMAARLQSSLTHRTERAEWTEVNVTDEANRETVDRFGVSRAPMPMVLCVAPNGAVTGAYTRPLSEEVVDRAIVTPAMARCLMALQNKKIAVLHVKPAEDSPLPDGASGFVTDPGFNERTEVIDVVIDDPEESRFVTDMEIDPVAAKDSIVVVMAPPGVLVGKFPATITMEQIAAELHAAGKCCNDPNCKHNKKGK